MADVTVEIDTGGGVFSPVSNPGPVEIRRRAAVSEASFRVSDASVQDRLDMRPGVEVHITITEGMDTIRFAGVIENPRVEVGAPGHFNLEVGCVGLEQEATRFPAWNVTYPDLLTSEQILTLQPGGAVGKDAFVEEASPNTNFGGNNTLAVSRDLIGMPPLAPDDRRRSFLEFDISSIPANSRIVEATVELKVASWGTTVLIPVGVRAVSGAWTEVGITWNNQPAYESPSKDQNTVSYAYLSYQWDVASIVQRWVDGVLDNNGLVFIADTSGTEVMTQTRKDFSSSGDVDAGDRPKLTVKYIPPVKYTDALVNMWGLYWSAIDTSKVVSDARTFGEKEVIQHLNLAQGTKRLLENLPKYEWWIEWDGTTKFLRAEPWGNTDPGVTLTESDVRGNFEMEPENTDIRNLVFVVGGAGGGDTPGPNVDPSDSSPLVPIRAEASDVNSQSTFGSRLLIIKDVTDSTRQKVQDRADAELEEQAWEYFRVRFDVRNFALQPGDKVTLNMPSLGINGVNFNDAYMVMATEDRLERGTLTRRIDLQEVAHL